MPIPFTNITITRDHIVFAWGKVLGLLALISSGLLDPNVTGVDPLALGLSPGAVHRIQAMATLVTVLSFWLGMSPLPLSQNSPLASSKADTALNPFTNNRSINR